MDTQIGGSNAMDHKERDRVDRLMERERERERVVDRRKREDKGGERRKSRDIRWSSNSPFVSSSSMRNACKKNIASI